MGLSDMLKSFRVPSKKSHPKGERTRPEKPSGKFSLAKQRHLTHAGPSKKKATKKNKEIRTEAQETAARATEGRSQRWICCDRSCKTFNPGIRRSDIPCFRCQIQHSGVTANTLCLTCTDVECLDTVGRNSGLLSDNRDLIRIMIIVVKRVYCSVSGAVS
jgi:hypothetical protein